MRNKLAFLILFTLILIGCKPSVPDGVLSPKEMEDVLYDYHLADAMAQDEDPGGKQLNGWHVDCFW